MKRKGSVRESVTTLSWTRHLTVGCLIGVKACPAAAGCATCCRQRTAFVIWSIQDRGEGGAKRCQASHRVVIRACASSSVETCSPALRCSCRACKHALVRG